MNDSFCSDSWFAREWRVQELALFWQLRQQHDSVSDTLFPYGIILAQPFPPPANIYCVGCDNDRTVLYVSAALRYIRKRSLECGNDLWLENLDMHYQQVSWSHGYTFVPYKYDQQAAEKRIQRLVTDAQNEQLKLDERSVPMSYQLSDDKIISGHCRPVLRGHEQHTQLLLDHGVLIVPQSLNDSYLNVLASTPFDLPVPQVDNPPMYFYPRPEIQDQTRSDASQIIYPNRDLTLSTENNGHAADTPMESVDLQEISTKNSDFDGDNNSDATFEGIRPELSPQTPSEPGSAKNISVVQHSNQYSNDSFGGSHHIYELHSSFVPEFTVLNIETHEQWEFSSPIEAADFFGLSRDKVRFAVLTDAILEGIYKFPKANPLQLSRPKRVVVEVSNSGSDQRLLFCSQGKAAKILKVRKGKISEAISSGKPMEKNEIMYYISYKEIEQTGHGVEPSKTTNK